MDTPTRSRMEASFGQDFSQVRIHTDARANASAKAVQALAYTVGPHIVFAAGAYRPETWNGRRLLAHELAHVVQQAGSDPSFPLRIASAHDPAERQAERAADAVAQGNMIEPHLMRSATLVQRAGADARDPFAGSWSLQSDKGGYKSLSIGKSFTDSTLAIICDYPTGPEMIGEVNGNQVDVKSRITKKTVYVITLTGPDSISMLAPGWPFGPSLYKKQPGTGTQPPVAGGTSSTSTPLTEKQEATCGPDVTQALAHAIIKIKAFFNSPSRTDGQRDQMCGVLVPGLFHQGGFDFMGWDVLPLFNPQLWQKDFRQMNPPCCNRPKPGGTNCADTVQVGRDCHEGFSVNYVMYGVMMSLCYQHAMKHYIRYALWLPKYTGPGMMAILTVYGGYKKLRRAITGEPIRTNLFAMQNWSATGYRGGSLVGAAERKDCSPTCPHRYPGVSMAVRWQPFEKI